MRILILSLLLGLAGCGEYASPWERAASTYTCTSEQMSKAQSEAKWCADNTSYFSSYCYGSAILRNCSAPADSPNK